MSRFNNSKIPFINLLFFVIASIGYIFIGYFLLRTDGGLLTGIYTLLFALFIFYYYKSGTGIDKSIMWLGLGLRALFLFSLPNLSDDFYRFIWDGQLLNAGINPFHHPPVYFIEHPDLAPDVLDLTLFEKLNSQIYFTIYPPVHQLIFWLSVWLSPDNILSNVIVMRVIILLAELGNFILIRRLLVLYNLPPKNAILYILNPLVIIEISGNIHFEAIMVFFILLSVFWLEKNKFIGSAIAMALAISTKLIPLIFLPFILIKLSFKRTMAYYGIVGVVVILTFIPITDLTLFKGFTESFSLYFQKFEFNASVYYVIRWIGWQLAGFNIINYAGKFLAFTVFIGIMYYAFKMWIIKSKLSLPHHFLWTLTMYLMLTTTLHPWYIIPLIAISIFTDYRFPIIWSLLIFFSYLSYQPEGVYEYTAVLLVEYIVVFGYLAFEIGILPKAKGFQRV